MSQADSSLSTNVLQFRRPTRPEAASNAIDARTLLLAACLKHMSKKSVGRVRQALFICSDSASKAGESARALIALQALDLIAEHN